MRIIRLLCLATLAGTTVIPAQTQTAPVESAHDLVRDVIYNELHDRERDSHWQYRSACVSSSRNIVREQVETDEGILYRVIERSGNPLDAKERHQEDARIAALLKSPNELARLRHEHEVDEGRLGKIMAIMPSAFLFEYEGTPTGDRVRIAFRPDPTFVPASYEDRIIHALGGTFTVNQRLKRMIDMSGHLIERVDFGYGILGHVEKDGTFEIRREQVSETHWKTNLVAVHIEGKVLLLKNVSKDQQESRSDFRPVPDNITLAAAKEILDQSTSTENEARLVHVNR